MIHNLIKRAPERVVAPLMMHAQRLSARNVPDLFLPEQHQRLGAGTLCDKRPDVAMDTVRGFLTGMYAATAPTSRACFTRVARFRASSIQEPPLLRSRRTTRPARPYKVSGMEVASPRP